MRNNRIDTDNLTLVDIMTSAEERAEKRSQTGQFLRKMSRRENAEKAGNRMILWTHVT